MIKRPLCAAALLLFFILLCIPAEVWMRSSCLSEGRGSPDVLTGEVCEIYPGGGSACIKDTDASDTGLVLVYFEAGTDIRIGNTIEISDFTLYEPEEPSNPGQFDSRLYYQTKKIVLICYAGSAEVVDAHVRPVKQFFYILRENLSARCALVFGEEYGGTVSAMLLGDKSGLDGEVEDLYQMGGISHLLAISGLHISIFGMSLYRLLRRIGASYTEAGVPAVILMLAYGLLTGMGTSTARALIMAVTSLVADMIGRSYDMLSALALAAVMLMISQPLYVHSASFLLSFGAILGIALIFPAVNDLFNIRGGPWKAVALSFSVQLMTLPLIEYFYYQIPVYSILLNLIVVPLMSLVVYLCVSAVALSYVWLWLGRLPAAAASGILWFFEKAAETSLKLPGAVFICGKPGNLQILLYYAGAAAFVVWRWKVREARRKRIFEAAKTGDDDLEEEKPEQFAGRRRAAAAAAFLLFAAALTVRTGRGFEFTMLDVGQGDGLFLRTGGGTTILIDGGSSSESEVGTYRILPFLKASGVAKLDYIIVTHADSDHISGIEEILEAAAAPGGMQVGTLLISEQALEEDAGQELLSLALEAGTEVSTVCRGMVLADEAVTVEFLYPVPGVEYDDSNACSAVLKVTYGEFTMLLTGDLGEEGELELIDFGDELDCDLLKVAHHGSKYSSSGTFIEAVSPEVALISCGEDNSYGHPHEETLQRLEAAGGTVFVTTEYGALTVRSDGVDFTVEGYLD